VSSPRKHWSKGQGGAAYSPYGPESRAAHFAQTENIGKVTWWERKIHININLFNPMSYENDTRNLISMSNKVHYM
jgi:hypothetical protein